MNKLLLFVFILSTFSAKSQTEVESSLITEYIDWLNTNTTTTIRYGSLKYERIFLFTADGLKFNNLNNIIYWTDIKALATTKTNRVYFAYSDNNFFEYVTPNQNSNAEEVLLKMGSILRWKQIKFNLWRDIADADENN